MGLCTLPWSEAIAQFCPRHTQKAGRKDSRFSPLKAVMPAVRRGLESAYPSTRCHTHTQAVPLHEDQLMYTARGAEDQWDQSPPVVPARSGPKLYLRVDSRVARSFSGKDNVCPGLLGMGGQKSTLLRSPGFHVLLGLGLCVSDNVCSVTERSCPSPAPGSLLYCIRSVIPSEYSPGTQRICFWLGCSQRPEILDLPCS